MRWLPLARSGVADEDLLSHQSRQRLGIPNFSLPAQHWAMDSLTTPAQTRAKNDHQFVNFDWLARSGLLVGGHSPCNRFLLRHKRNSESTNGNPLLLLVFKTELGFGRPRQWRRIIGESPAAPQKKFGVQSTLRGKAQGIGRSLRLSLAGVNGTQVTLGHVPLGMWRLPGLKFVELQRTHGTVRRSKT